jgi:hypothetical protein
VGIKKPASALARAGHNYALAVYLTCPQAETQIDTNASYQKINCLSSTILILSSFILKIFAFSQIWCDTLV